MKRKISEKIEIPQGAQCSFENNILKCKKDSVELSRKIEIPGVKIKIGEKEITLEIEAGNRDKFKQIMANMAHIKNIFYGLERKFVYKMQACNVHFPMTLKVDKNKLLINNFLGEKQSRKAEIIPGVNVEIKGQDLTISSHDKEAAGQTAANIEKATKVRYKDRRIFQDGIYIVEKAKEEGK